MPHKIALCQMPVAQADIDANLDAIAQRISQAASKGATLAIFPELCTTGFHWHKNKTLLDEHTRTTEQISSLCAQHKIGFYGSILAPHPQGGAANTALLIAPDGTEIARYRKIHLFTLVGEHKYLTPGETPIVCDSPWGRLGLAICYDMRFPELFRRYALQGAQAFLLCAAFPHPRLAHWQTLLRARAIEDQAWLIAVNQTGTETFSETNKLTYFGHSTVIDPWGKIITEADEADGIHYTTIAPEEATPIREKMTVLQDRRPELY